jgi:hypothetical protein
MNHWHASQGTAASRWLPSIHASHELTRVHGAAVAISSRQERTIPILRHAILGVAAAVLVSATIIPDEALALRGGGGRGGAHVGGVRGGGAHVGGVRGAGVRSGAIAGRGTAYRGAAVGAAAGAAAVGAGYYGRRGYYGGGDYYGTGYYGGDDYGGNCYRNSYGRLICP